jgi:hypothetical protein
VQDDPAKIVLRAVVSDKFSRDYEALLIRNARERISNDIQYAIERVPSIKRSRNGKFIPVSLS